MALLLTAAVIMSLVSDRPAIAEVIGGVVMVGVSVILGWSLTSRLAAEADPGRVLVLDFLLVLVVLLGLVGVTLIGLAIPVPVVG